MNKQPLLVLVKWIDSTYYQPSWETIQCAKQLDVVSCVSAGWLVKKTKRRIVLAISRTNDQYGGLICIPRCAVQSIKRLR